MSGLPADANNEDEEDFDFDLGELDDLDDEELNRLLDEDPTLEEELRAIEAAEIPSAEEPPAEEPSADAPPFAEPSADATLPAVSAPAEENDDEDQEAELELPPIEDDLEEMDFDSPAGGHQPLATASDEFSAPAENAGVSYDDDNVDPASLNLAPIPRINVHAFCVSQHATRLIETTAQDRRMAKAHLTIHAGDSLRASQIYAGEASPNLLLIEAAGRPDEVLHGLDQLANVCDPSTRVICFGELNDIRLYRSLMDRGISEYIVSPKSPLQLISSIGELYADPAAPPLGKSYVFVGARGGSGSSTICHNVAWSIAQDIRSDTILMDLDLPFGTASLDFEHDPSQGLAEALSAPERLDDVLLDRLLQKCTDRLSLFVAPNMLDRDYDMPAESYETVVDQVRKSAPSVAIDLPHMWSGWTRHLLETADEIVITVTPDLSSFRNAKNLIEAVKASRSNDAEPILVLNQVGVPKRPEVPAEQFEDSLGISPIATIPWDPVSFGLAATNAEALAESAPKSKAVGAFRDIAAKLTGQQPSVRKGGRGLKSLFSKSG